MAATAVTRSFVISNTCSSFALSKRFFFTSCYYFSFSPRPPHSFSTSAVPSSFYLTTLNSSATRSSSKLVHKSFSFFRSFCSSEIPTTPPKRNTKVNFSLSDSDSESDAEDSRNSLKSATKEIDKSKLPPPYNPFNKKPAIEEPEDPKNLQEVFHKIRTDGLINNAVKMFDALSKDGLTHEALELFAQIKDKGNMPDVVAHTAVIEAYANAGQPKEAHKVYMRMLASGVLPNAYTYTVLIKSLAGSGDAKLVTEAKKYVAEMMGKKIKPNAGTYVAVFEALVKEGRAEEARDYFAELMGKGFVPDEKAAREVLKDKRGPAFRSVMSILFNK